MRLQMTSRINADGDDPIFLMFHGYGNDESEMVRILDAVYAPARFHTDLSVSSAPVGSSDFADSDYSVNHAESAHGETGPSYISFRATYPRPYAAITGIRTAAAWKNGNGNARRSAKR